MRVSGVSLCVRVLIFLFLVLRSIIFSLRRSKGYDHAWALPGDLSNCFALKYLHTLIKVSHFGRMFPDPAATRHVGRITEVNTYKRATN